MNDFPFPYKFYKRANLRDGLIVRIPSLCARNNNNSKCRLFYSNLSEAPGLYKCPYGFAVAVEYINDRQIFFCGLNILSISERKMMRKAIKDAEFNPQMTKTHFASIIEELKKQNKLEEKQPQHAIKEQINEDIFIDKKILIEDTIHELRKLNRDFKVQCEELISMMDEIRNEELHQQARKVFALSQLMSIRLDTYDFGMNPINLLNKSKQPMCIHKKITKAAKCLFPKATSNNVYIRWEGDSYSEFLANDVVELLPYILIDNAIKYSHPKHDIVIKFEETDQVLTVYITSCSLRPLNGDVSKLMDRGYRDPNAAYLKDGKGIGLYLANTICKYNDIDISISLGQNRETKDGYIYSDFNVKLVFRNIIKQYANINY